MTQKLKLHSPDLTQVNIDKLAALFPSCLTESKDEAGQLKRTIDFDLLRQELSGEIVEGPQERYQLNWPGKREALLTANAPIAKTLRPCRDESVDFDNTKNLFIEGDNLDALKLLQEAYLNKVKMIYIDPPYNTGNDFIYDDDFVENSSSYFQRTNQIDSAGNRMIVNSDASGRFHSDWLSMIYPRIKLARNLLTDDGVLFVSIDDNESANLQRICEEIFGDRNFIASLSVQINPRGRHLDRFIAKTHECVLIFGKDVSALSTLIGLNKVGRMVDEYDRGEGQQRHRLLGLRNRNQAYNPATRKNLYYPIYVNPSNGKVAIKKSATFIVEVWPDTPEGIKTCWTWEQDTVIKDNARLVAELTSDGWRVFRKDFLYGPNGEIAKTLAKSLWIDKEIANDYGRKAVKQLFSSSVMDFPKSPFLIKKLIEIGTSKTSIVMDFFSGSATTAHAVMELNAEDSGNRQYVMVQLPATVEDNTVAHKAGYETIAEIGKERIRRAGKKVKDENPNKLRIDKLDIGFRALKVDTSNMKEVYYSPDAVSQDSLFEQVSNIREDRSPEDLLFQVLLDWGVDLTLPIAQETIDGKLVLFVDGNALAACFDIGITEDFVKLLAKRAPLRAVFRDAGFTSDSVKINVSEIFKLMSPSTEVRVI
jgi:adenine-specific DNA-methyltransferase